MAYRASFWMMAISGFVIGGLDFVGIWIMFSAVDSLGGFDLVEIAFLYGATRARARHRRPVRRPDRTARPDGPARQARRDDGPAGAAARPGVRRRVRPAPVGPGRADRPDLRVGCAYVDWTPTKVLLAAVDDRLRRGDLLRGLRRLRLHPVLDGRLQRGRERVHLRRQHDDAVPTHDLPAGAGEDADLRVPAGVRQLVPLLYILGRPDPLGLPEWVQFASPVAALVLLAAAALVWRTGVRHYTSTGS